MVVSAVVPGTAFCVDNFATNYQRPAVFFLTHCHADHMGGLDPYWRGQLHTSVTSALYLRRKFGTAFRAFTVTHELDVPFDVLDPASNRFVTCTFVDAAHCPGAVMIIFENLPNGRGPVIHTGDFRYVPEMKQN